MARNPPQGTRYTFSHSVFIIRAKTDDLLPSYLLWFLRQDWCIEWLLLEMNSNAGVPTLGKSVMESLPITVPHNEEQKEIVRHIENFLSYADKIESYYQNAFTQVEQLATTILSKAFRGELGDQDPNEESASVLLEKIQIERAAKPKAIQRKRKSKMPKIDEKYVKEVVRQIPEEIFLFDELKKGIPDDYDVLKDVLFTLLDESEPSIMQVFEPKAGVIQFVRRVK